MTSTRRHAAGAIACLGLAMVLAEACASRRPVPASRPPLEQAVGFATFYGPGFHGRLTASGIRFDQHALVAAHATYPFGTRVRVTALRTGCTVIVRIVDRGPASGPRSRGTIIDLSKGAAGRLRMIEKGRILVRVDVLEWGDRIGSREPPQRAGPARARGGSYTRVVPAPTGFDLIGIGTNSIDTVLRVPRLPDNQTATSKIRVTEKTVSLGGQTATALATCAAFGLKAAYTGAIGLDPDGDRMYEELARRGVDLSFAVRRDAPSHWASILVEENTGERIVLWGRDERLALEPAEIPGDAIRSARVLHVDDVDVAAAVRAARIARDAGVPVTSDLDRLDEAAEELLSVVTFPIFAAHVPEMVTGVRDPERALRLLRNRHPGTLCVTLGAEGAMALEADRLIYSPAFSVRAVDTTGAGDVFRGGFIFGLLNGWTLDRILQFANAAAALSCTRAGAMNGVPTLAEVKQLISERGDPVSSA